MGKKKPAVREHSGQSKAISKISRATAFVYHLKHYEIMAFKALCQSEFLAGLVTKTLKVMKITASLLLIACLHVSATGLSQAKVSISGKNLSIEDILKEISAKTDYQYVYSDQEILGVHRIDISVRDVAIEYVLDLCFKDQPFTYEINGKIITVKRRQSNSSSDIIGGPTPKTITAKGVVLNESGQPLEGATITDKQTGRSTITNAKGEYQLSDVPVNSTLMVTFVGYAEQDIKVKDVITIQINLTPAKNELDKVVIQAYGTTTARLNTGNISTVTSEQIERQPVMNVLSALQGEAPGLVITQTSGYASAPFKVEIRGRSVINPSLASEPLYIIDGVPLTVVDYGNNGSYSTGSVGFTQNGFTGPAGGQSPLFSLNPADIESVTVLKDADATSIYGSRGANGVIFISTKSGKPGRSKLEINLTQGESIVTNHYDLMNTHQYLQMRREAFKNDGISMNPGNAYDLLQFDTTRYTDWQKYLWGGIAQYSDIDMAISGGDKQTTYRLSGAYHRQTSILTKNGADQRASLQFNLTHKSLSQRLTTTFSNAFSYVTSNLVSSPSVVLMPPDAPSIYNSDGLLNFSGWGPVNSSPASSIGLFQSLFQQYTAQTAFINSHLNTKFELTKGLVLAASVGYSTEYMQQKQFEPISSQDPRTNPVGTATFGNNTSTNVIVEPTVDYKVDIAKGKLGLLLGGTAESASGAGNTLTGTGFTNDGLLGSVANAPIIYGYNGSGEYKYAAFYGRLNYNWNDKYIINITGRRDGSSKFGAGKQYGDFGSVGAAWLFSEENIIKKILPFLSFGKFRGSYGTTGSDQIPGFQYLSLWSANGNTPYQQNGAPSFTSQYLSNPNLVWQSNHKLEGAIDLGFMKDKLLIELARYRDRCGNQLVPFILPVITGFSSVTANLPALVQNSGWEGTVKYKFSDSRLFTGAFNFNIGINRNKLIKFPGLATSPYAAIYDLGKSLNIRRLLHYTGVDPLTGQYSYEDKNHDGSISRGYFNNGDDDSYDKDMSVKFEGGAGFDLRYSQLSLNLFFQYRSQQLQSATLNGGIPGTIGTQNNQSIRLLARWQKAGDAGPYARYTTQPTGLDGSFQYSDGDYSNGSYIRLKNLSVSYDLTSIVFKKSPVASCKIFIRGENLLLISKYDGLDPDTPGLGTLPPQKTFVAGLQINL